MDVKFQCLVFGTIFNNCILIAYPCRLLIKICVYKIWKLIPGNILMHIAGILVDFDENIWCEHVDSISQFWIDQYLSERSKDHFARKIIN